MRIPSLDPVSAAWLTPLVLGLATAYAVSGALAPVSVPLATGPEPVQARGPNPAQDPAQAVLDKNILGLAMPAREASSRETAAQGSDPSGWQLLGTVTGSRASALVQADGKVRLVYREESLSGWRLDDVREDGVSWLSGRSRREIALRKEAGAESGVKPETRPGAGPKPGADGQASGVAKSTKVQVVKSEVAHLLGDPNALLQQARFSPYKRDGEVEGFRLGNVKQDSVFKRMGLQNGDVLLSVNGQRIDGHEALLRVYSGLESAQAVNMSIRRRGEISSVLVEFN